MGIIPRRSSLSPKGAKYITGTQDTSPIDVAEVCNQYLFDRAKIGNLGASDHQKNNMRTRKKGIT